jgi:hypothetical protein
MCQVVHPGSSVCFGADCGRVVRLLSQHGDPQQHRLPSRSKEHTCFIVTSGNQSMCLIGDRSHHPVLLPERPRSQFIYDIDPLQADEMRVKVLGMLSKESHSIRRSLPWPDVGHVAEEKDGFRYFSGTYQVGFQIISSAAAAEDLIGEGFINEGMVRSGDSQDLRSWQSCSAQGCAFLICGGDPQQRHPRLDRVHARHHAGCSRSGPGRTADWRIASDHGD